MNREERRFIEKVNKEALKNPHKVIPALLKDAKKIGDFWIARNPREPNKLLSFIRINEVSGEWETFELSENLLLQR